MGVYIKGMRMPENCSECPVALSGKYCRINKTCETFKALPIRPTHCPLIALPDKHGRLVDADAMMDDICNSINQMTKIGIAVDGNYLWGKLNDALDSAPTIVEAEGET